MNLVLQAAKAVFAAVTTFLGTTIASLTTGQSLGDLDTKTWLTIVLATVISGAGVYGISNKQ